MPLSASTFKEDKSSEGEKLCVAAGPDEGKCTQQVSHC